MSILAAVATLGVHPDARPAVVEALAAFPGVEVGALQGHRLPVVLETEGPRDDKARFDALLDVPGVVAVDLVWADFSDLVESSSEVVP